MYVEICVTRMYLSTIEVPFYLCTSLRYIPLQKDITLSLCILTMSSARGEGSSGRRWGRKSQGSRPPPGEADESFDDNDFPTASYIPTSYGGGATASSNTPYHLEGQEQTPSSQPKKGLGSLSSRLFRGSSRRKSSKSRSKNLLADYQGAGAAMATSNKRKKKSSSTSASSVVSFDDDRSVNSSRVFYSSNQDDDSDTDSYESKMSQALSRTSEATPRGGGRGHDDPSTAPTEGPTTILRYRGFSTSIQSLFLDEQLVCASMGCFGLILSNRTEYLLQMRNDRRGVRWGKSSSGSDSRQTLPSRILAYALLLTLLLIASTFVIWGFGSHGDHSSKYAEAYYEGYDAYNDDDTFNNNYANANNGGDDDGNGYGNRLRVLQDSRSIKGSLSRRRSQNTTNHDTLFSKRHRHSHRHPIMPGVFKLRDVNDLVWIPGIDFLKDEWNAQPQPFDEEFEIFEGVPDVRLLEDQGAYSYSGRSSTRKGNERDLAANIRISLLFAFLVVLGVLGRRRRMRTRYYLTRARAQEDHLFYASTGVGIRKVAFQDTREDQYEGACSHTLCGCYPVDPAHDGTEIDQEVEVGDEGLTQRKKKHRHEDCVSRAFKCLMQSCCGMCCKCWFQCLSICALAQEAREIRLLLPPRYQRIDFITHQPFHEYQKDIIDMRRGWRGKSGLASHLNAMSRLSRYILVLFCTTFLAIMMTLLFNPRAAFSWPDAIVLVATFSQSFLALYVVHWLFHKSDLSLDAVVKFFAAGFLIAVPSAFFFQGMLMNVTLWFAWLSYALSPESLQSWVSENYVIFWVFGELFNAYVIAAVTEELCKYYTFRCVEHPDLLFLTGLDRKSQDDRAVEGGVVQYPFGSHQIQQSNKEADVDDDVSVYSRMSRASHRSSSKNRKMKPAAMDEDFAEDEIDVRTHRQKAAAVTTGMISVAVGLACAENFMYVFLLGGTSASGETSGVLEEWIVLFFRSIFPVHALAAAMQSINMIRKFVECDNDGSHRVGVGRIILPAVIMHGTFDAILLAINVYIESSWDDYIKENGENYDGSNPPYNALLVNLVAWISIVMVLLTGIGWYYREYRKQRARLIVLEEEEKADDYGYVDPYLNSEESPTKRPVSEMELV